MFKRDIIIGAIFLLVGGTGGFVYAAEQTITVCHATDSAKNPYVLITVAANSLTGHEHTGDFIPAPDAIDCSQLPPPPPPGI